MRYILAVLSTCILASVGAMAVVSTDSAFGAAPVNSLPVAPGFTSSNTDSVAPCSPFTYIVTTTGVPEPAISLTAGSVLPTGVTLTDNGNGTAAIDGTSSVAAGSYSFDLTATNGLSPNATQRFTLNVGASLDCELADALQAELQLTQNTYSQAIQLVSNILKDIEATAASIVENLKS